MRITLLGTGTSTGVPMIGCQCRICTSSDPRDKRLRVSALIETPETTILIDTTPDFRQQMLNRGIRKLDAILYTHRHFDHIAGFDDLRAFQFLRLGVPMCYANQDTYDGIRQTFPYAFDLVKNTGGGGVPQVPFTVIEQTPFAVGDLLIEPVRIDHGMMDILGFRIGGFAYLTDCKRIPVDSKEKLKSLDVMVLDGLRHTPHPTHLAIDESIAYAKELRPKMTYLTHMNHDVLHAETESRLPPNIRLAYDGLAIEL
ncbi:MAG: MBL fold metallo-hydrolase [Bacteroidetes bacterium]|nr:MBL fold metallo-hydrolase [Bacteroidota bacterium]